MRIMIAGQWRWPQYEEAFARGLRDNGVEVIELRLGRHFAGPLGRLQKAVALAGPAAMGAGRAIVAAARRARPDFVLFWRPTHILSRTLRALRRLGVATISYNNDDPFSPGLADEPGWHRRSHWRLYLKALPLFDFNFFYRPVNCEEAKARGARHADLLLPYFLPWQERPVELSSEEMQRFGADVAFIGHFEDDGRDRDILALSALGISVRVWGDATWAESALKDSGAVPWPITTVVGEDYAKALSGAQLCLCYMSKLNRDGYTRRCFEIPATGRAMLAERTAELSSLFQEDVEACFFSSRDELVRTARRLLDNEQDRQRIAEAGRRRVWVDGHDVSSRARQFVAQLSNLRVTAKPAPSSEPEFQSPSKIGIGR